MDNNGHGPGFFPGPAFSAHHGDGSTLGWVIFALQLLMLAGLAVLLARAFMRPHPAGPDRKFVRTFQRGPRPGGPADPLEIARYRYARGELSRDAYLQVVRDLGGDDDAPMQDLPPA